MDNRPIGIFDSGIGGLTSIQNITRYLPKESIVFFGDTARAPYGSKSIEMIQNFTLQTANFLRHHDVKMIVIACNTVSAHCLELLKKNYPEIPIIGVIKPTAKKISSICDHNSRVCVLATKATTDSRVYEKEIKALNPEIQVYSVACPAFVPLIEEGIVDHDIMEVAIRMYLDDLVKEHDITHFVLGCTHYPLLADQLRSLYPGVEIISSSHEVFYEIRDTLIEKEMLSEAEHPEHLFYASDVSHNFVNMISRIRKENHIEEEICFHNLDQ